MNFNNPIKLRLPKKKGPGGYQSAPQQYLTIPPLNAVINTAFGAPPQQTIASKAIVTIPANQLPIQFSWASVGKGSVGDPNNYRTNKLKNYKPSTPFDQGLCGSCWVISTSMAFADRYAIANDQIPVTPNFFGVLSCCTSENYKKTFAIIATPDCNVNGTYGDFVSGNNSAMGMCNGGIPYSAAKAIQRNGLPKTSKQPYVPSLFQSGTNPNQEIIMRYPCGKDLFKEGVIRMSSVAPAYISNAAQARGSPDYYVRLMKNALLDGPLVAGFVVTGDFLGLGTQIGWKPGAVDWDQTGKVFVNGAYNQRWSSVSTSEVGGQGTVRFQRTEGKNTVGTSSGDTVAPLGNILCGFHAIVIVGYGEMDMDYVPDKTVRTVVGRDGRRKLPFWVCRNSWGTQWPPENYYNGRVQTGKDEYLEVPPGHWLHAMWPNESLGFDIPVIFDGSDYGCTMTMSPSVGPTPPGPAGPIKYLTRTCNKTWKDADGFGCSDYGQQGWCTPMGQPGPGWKKEWGSLPAGAKDCCECKPYSEQFEEQFKELFGDTCLSGGEIAGIVLGCIFGTIFLIIIILYSIYYFRLKNYFYVTPHKGTGVHKVKGGRRR